ncbi:DNA cytosine methyltransferase [Mesorhizobium sp. CAU 1732]|uniref:DNA cytosine methyltransferase n=1 Tax=Mesorhizobium sp. CAU 1732 TaxID=3140358 RepID=UPI003261A996
MLVDLFPDAPSPRTPPTGRPLIIDSFAGGGGASTGIEMALGRSPDIAINHSPDALAMHEVNHPDTLHLSRNIYQVDPIAVVGNRRVGLAWFSPDCKHFSKAKGGKPVKRNIRDLAWIVVDWARRVRPEVIILENVEEFKDWGPVLLDGKPCPYRKGATFKVWTDKLKRLGYRLEFRELRACDYGAPTIRKRFFMIARCDGQPIVWPQPSHGKPDDPDVIAGRKLPWRTAAEIIDWSLPCPSIFDTSDEIMKAFGLRAIRPLAEATMRRIARGVLRYVIEAKRPFIVTYGQHGGANRSPDDPLHTVTASPKDQNAIIVPSFVGCGGRAGQCAPRGGAEPLGTLTAKPDGCVVATYVSRFTQNGIGSAADEPLDTVMAGAPKFGVVAAYLAQHNNDSRRIGGVNPGRPADEPLSTLTIAGAQQNVAAAHLSHLYSSNTRGGAGDVGAPIKTITAGGNHAALISGFLTKYYGEALPNQSLDEPVHTVTTKPRHGLVTVEVDGETFAIADIGMRMLTPRERFRAQGFPESYIIDRRPDGSPLSATVQGSCCGNSVCPPLAQALVAANCAHLVEHREAAE